MNFDIVRVVAGGLIALGSGYIGIAIKRHYKNREAFFKDALEFVQTLKSEMSFRKTTLPNAARSFAENRKGDAAKAIGGWAIALRSGCAQKYVEDFDASCLKDAEKKKIRDVLNDLGKTDLNDQLGLLDRTAKELENKKQKCAVETEKLGNMYFKLAVILGIAAMVIVV